MSEAFDIAGLIRQIPTQYPFVLVDRVLEHDPSGRLVAIKNVTGSEEFFQGHFPQSPVMPGVLLMESLAQAAGLWLMREASDPAALEVHLVGIDEAKFRKPAVPGDQLRLEVSFLRRHGPLCRVRGEVKSGEHRVAEATLLLQVLRLPQADVDPTARVAAGAVLGPGVRVGPYAVVGPKVRIGARSVIQAHAIVDGDTTLGADNQVFPYASIGLAPQDLKYRGEPTRLEIGDRNAFREFVTVHRGTAGGGGLTRIGSDNLFMAYTHVAHDCLIGSHTIFANGATLAGHVEVADHAQIGAFSGVHQFCRVGMHAFLGGYTVATKDVLPYSKTVGSRPACIYGVNTIGLTRRGFAEETVAAIRHAFRILLQSRLNTTDALARIESEPMIPEVRGLVEFVRGAARGVILKRAHRLHHDEDV